MQIRSQITPETLGLLRFILKAELEACERAIARDPGRTDFEGRPMFDSRAVHRDRIIKALKEIEP